MPSSFRCPQLARWLLACLLTTSALAGDAGHWRGNSTNVLLANTRFATPAYFIDSGQPGPTVMIVGGVHGNEPAGALAAESIRHWPVQQGRLIVIPRANVPGLTANSRLIPGQETNLNNLNRNYPRAGQTDHEARGELAQAIWQIATNCHPDWILDLHEGYDFHQLNEKSVGSSVICFPLPAGQLAADTMLAAVNATITNASLKFVRRNMPVDGSLARAAGEHLQVPGMTLETTDKLPLEKRVTQHEIMVRQLFVHLGMCPGAILAASDEPAAAASEPGPVAAPKLKIALYKGPGTAGQGPPNLMKMLNASNAPTTLVEISPAEICAGELTNYAAVIFAGGSGSVEAKSLGEAGRAEVKRFVSQGGGYVGICAGAYLALANYPWSLHIINARSLSPKWQRGRAVLKMEATPAGQAILGGSNVVDVLYHQGPVVGPAGETNLPPYEPLAFFRTEVADNDTPKGIMVDSPAIFAGAFDHGRVLCISPHPEQTEGLEYILPQAVNWVTRAPAAAAQ